MGPKSLRNLFPSMLCIALCSLAGMLSPGTTFAQTSSQASEPQAQQVVLLPIIDEIQDKKLKKIKLDLNRLRDHAKKTLEEKKYSVTESDVTGDLGGTTLDNATLSNAQSDLIKRLGPPDSILIVVIVLDADHKARNALGRTEATGYLFDKRSATLLWHASDYEHEKDAKNFRTSMEPLANMRPALNMRVAAEDAIEHMIDDHQLPAPDPLPGGTAATAPKT